jgi:hypothetical protein
MQSFIVLGIIPGTNIQTDLNFWVAMSILYAVFITRRFWYTRLRQLHVRYVAWQITQAIRNYEFVAV